MIDLAKIKVKAGNGGDGCISFRREKFIPKGGPDGGDGGRGGSVYFISQAKKVTLLDFQYNKIFQAQRGRHGSGAKKTGLSGEDLIIEVPVGTIVREYKESEDNKKLREMNHTDLSNFPILYDFNKIGLEHKIAKGGLGGKGNWHFRSSENRIPRVAERGQSGEEKELILELKLIADVGLIGIPNAGKSTLLSKLTLARPKIADYPFTTISPVLGVCEQSGMDFVIADIPGIIEGASSGKGLGYEFLRHVERTKILIHLLGLDDQKSKPDDYFAVYNQINDEIVKYSKLLGQKKQIVVMNKMDLPYVKEIYKDVRSMFKRHNVELLEISGFTGKGLEDLKRQIVTELNEVNKNAPKEIIKEEKIPTFTLTDLTKKKRVVKELYER
ncbi:hypothetical protein A2X44_02785 [candidate division CPR3 bacterium GWF2_35_18]|uniref:GTPase Obg n=1 Tax=candidate division CPR3 bacterium GW2011_GWF2_35_18 TaxID=1618350 RepID=A0A0G0E2J6_UNCC3|nr:MAG: GTPase obg [candidate division CPR3 bacterium GW2011_GWF2_35_18]OGB62913.1 MAG: hypothetical protein A2X44_02785 [candidate division CPR3 bacterium GWF2_35_18]OGB65961.1 MAG: hypothetical protein A2250_03605 [candidate division CPR3 bacterium RIFOXYA2_FULL_35_13]OGB75720.1 MAG: hypothetical protein A2476_05250 [candidate division CPR3 bacterium RIFOXYC2_FULL_35_7]OGB79181.1 MAG: hypothetical protein A2296_00960 [candidate division CPR3 bacterium RIFOXYB2_FULL_35_8]